MRYVNVFCMTNRLERKRSRIYDFVFLHRTFKNTKTQPRSVHTYIYIVYSAGCATEFDARCSLLNKKNTLKLILFVFLNHARFV